MTNIAYDNLNRQPSTLKKKTNIEDSSCAYFTEGINSATWILYAVEIT